MQEDFNIELQYGYYISPNKNGSGLALTLNRGIPCDNHRQSFTSHCQFDKESVIKVLELYKTEFSDSISHFVNSINNLPRKQTHHYDYINHKAFYTFEVDYNSQELMAAVYFQYLIKEFAARVEKVFCQK